MSDLADLLAHLSPEQQELFRLRLARLHQASAPPAAPPIPRQPRTGAAFPLSFGQQRLWFLDQLMADDLSYVIPLAVRLSGRLDQGALERSLHALIQRHETLRTTFAQGADLQPVQVITDAPTEHISLPLIDLSDWPSAERHAEARRRATTEIRRPFDLQAGPLLRPTLLRLDDHEHWLILAMHHIISDQWSMGVLVHELGTLYQTYAADPSAATPLPAPTIQYADFVMWLRDQLRGEVLDQHVRYWQQQLAELPHLELPTDFARPPIQTSSGATQALALPLDVSTALQALSQREGATLFMTLLAAFDVLLYRLSGQTDIAVGSPIANRTHPDTEQLIGFFINTLVLRADLAGNPTFRELLGRVRRMCLDAYAHQDLPFEMAVEAAQARRDLSRNPLFQVSFVLLNTPMEPLRLPELGLYPLELERGATQFDITLSIMETAAGLRGRLEYNTDLFTAATITRLLEQFSMLLTAIAATPDQAIADLPLLTDAERQRVLRDWNATAAQVDYARPVHVRFSEQATRTPEATAAIDHAGQRHSFAELDRRSNQLAQHLQTLGIRPESCVGIYLERSPALIVALLAVLKAGGTYVPLDPAYPAERLQFILADAQVPLVITHTPLRDRLPPSLARTLDLDSASVQIDAAPGMPIALIPQPDQLAYIIYTSGSTGQPKGAMITHGGLINYLQWAVATYHVADAQGAPLHSPLGFDLTVTSLFTPLLASRSIQLLPEGSGIEPLAAALSARADYSLVKLTPAHLDMLRYALPADQLAGQTRAFVIGGEALQHETIAMWRAHAPQTHLFNEYGPTETVVGCCVYEVPPDAEISGAVPIGRPIANTQLYVLDQRLQPVPIGAAGELYIGGAGVARGYLNRPALTAERFIPDPFSPRSGARLYRSGDRVRWTTAGVLDYLGRLDDQIKLRGYRIEPAEIASVLRQHPAVRDCAVVLRGSGDGRYLAAYVVGERVPTGQTETGGIEDQQPGAGVLEANQEPGPEDEGTKELQIQPSDLRQFLKTRLPDYMMPSAFVALPALPVTANGKLDRRALPDPDQAERTDTTARSATEPRTPVEQVLALIWGEVLSRTQIDVHANFFDLRGHSLLAVQVIGRLKEIFPLDLSLQLIFEAPTIATLATRIVEIGAAQQLDMTRIAQLFIQLDQLSDDEVARMLAEQRDD